MIQINKRAKRAPAVLLIDGVTETTSNNTAYQAGTRKFKFLNSIYGHPTVKTKLIDIQDDKCCFCERKVSAGEPGHIEHYRPKGGYKKDDQSKLIKPGYYWLAYDFNNLFFSCNRCNTSYKKNYFPLVDETKRAINNSAHDIYLEDPLIISPSDDPKPHLIFVKEKIKPNNRSIKGKETIKRTGLNRRTLSKERSEYLRVLDTLAKVARGTGSESQEAKDHFVRISKPESVFSYMVVCNFPDLI